jgi:hypothetical protein
MPVNYVLISEQTVSAPVASVTFSNIPQTGYTDLKIVVSARRTSATDFGSLTIAFNGSSSSFANRILVGTGSAVAAGIQTTAVGPLQGTLTTANTFNNNEIYIPNYTSSRVKSYSFDGVLENNTTDSRAILGTGIWSATPAAITSVTLGSDLTGNFAAGSTFCMYGIAAFGTTPTVLPKATGGDIISNDGTYWYHAFLSSGVFTPLSNLSCDYLVVAGGGGGSVNEAGGGGAGGLRSTVTATGGGGSLESALSLTSGIQYPVTIGAGGATASGNGIQGSSSIFSTITSVGGGGGGNGGVAGAAGGSGGGGGAFGSNAGGARTVNQGFAGGNGSPVNGGAGGGGGAGAVGVNGTASSAGNGGAGVSISAFASATNTGVSNFYAGGGGGGAFTGSTQSTGGAGGGGAGGAGTPTVGTAGTVNTGGGGGGGGTGGTIVGGAGGSGIVIVRYTMA